MSKRRRVTASSAAGQIWRAVGGARGVARGARSAFKLYGKLKKRRGPYSRRSVGNRYRSKIPRMRTSKQQRQVKRLQRKMDMMCLTTKMAKHTHRQRRASAVSAAAKACQRVEYNDGGTYAEIEDAMGSLRYFDPNTNAMVVRSPAAGTYKRELCVSIYRKIFVTNNYHIPCHVTVWSCVPKGAVARSPLFCLDSGINDQGLTTSDVTSHLVHLTDSADVAEFYTVKSYKRVLAPGKSMTVRAVTPEFQYEFAANDIRSANPYNRSQGGHFFVVEIRGVLAHDSVVLGQVSFARAGVDIVRDTTYVFKYDAGKSVTDYSLDDNVPTSFSNVGIVSNKPVVSQQAYTG